MEKKVFNKQMFQCQKVITNDELLTEWNVLLYLEYHCMNYLYDDNFKDKITAENDSIWEFVRYKISMKMN